MTLDTYDDFETREKYQTIQDELTGLLKMHQISCIVLD